LTFVLALLVWALPAEPGTVPGRLIHAHFTATPPTIDGVLEEVWQAADSACAFTQLTPDYDSVCTESTTAYVLYDERNLYVAFRCLARDATTVRAKMTGTNDGIRLVLDTFEDNTSAYAFSVSAGGVEAGYRVTNDGAWIEEWDGVWSSKVRLEPWGYAVELAIPFKTLRYLHEKTNWGIDFGRYIIGRGEKSYWSRHEKMGFKVSNIGRLEGIRVPSAGLHLEAYPVGLVRYEYDTTGHIVPAAGLDVAWLPTPTANIQLTTLPDFAQIEADPYQVNLSKYELYLDERRPFFVEAAENFGTGPDYIRMFYSRRIGKRFADGTEVPIIGGGKYTDRIERFQVGVLGAVTGRTGYDYYGTDTVEPASVYSVASLRRQVLGNSELGILYAGKDNKGFSNHGIRADGVYRQGNFTATLYGAGSQMGDSLDHALAAEATYQGSSYSGGLTVRQTAPRFDMNGIGYTGWRGQSVYAYAGPNWYSTPLFQSFSVQVNGAVEREWGYEFGIPYWNVGTMVNGGLRNLTYANVWANWNASRFQDTIWNRFSGLDLGFSAGTDPGKSVSLSGWGDFVTRTYNYNRMILASSGQGGVSFSFQFGDHVSLDVGNEFVAEFQSTGALDPDKDLTMILRPSLGFAFTPKMTLSIGNETVRGYDAAASRPYDSYYFSLLYKWTVRPRSTFYIALNQRLEGSSGDVSATGTIAVVKLRYLFVF
jgi:hypothetical protein